MKFLAVLSLLVAASCASISSNTVHDQISLNDVKKLPIGSNTAQVRAVLGNPDRIVPGESSDRDLWIYPDISSKTHGRVALEIDNRDQKVQSIDFNLNSADPEQSLELARSAFPGARFKKNRLLKDYGHYMEIVESYDDTELGIELGVDTKTNLVNSISWFGAGGLGSRSEQLGRNGLKRVTRLPAGS
jgi:outer membrane protein assembly factor BamE (lipoprotein component of BamABCDE complex)